MSNFLFQYFVGLIFRENVSLFFGGGGGVVEIFVEIFFFFGGGGTLRILTIYGLFFF